MHGAVLLRSKFFTPEQVERITTDHRTAGLDPTDTAILDLVEKVVLNAYKVTPEDIERLREVGLDDGEIVDVVLAAGVRCFISKALDALGAEPEPSYDEVDPTLSRIARFAT